MNYKLIASMVLVGILSTISYASPDNSLQQDIDNCAKGNSYSCSCVGTSYQVGDHGVDKNIFIAKEYHEKGCLGKMSGSCRALGFMYLNGNGTRQDKDKAKEFFGKACDYHEEDGCLYFKMIQEGKM